MYKRKNPFESKWERKFDFSKLSYEQKQIIIMIIGFQAILDTLGIQEEIDITLYLTAFENWRKKYPEYTEGFDSIFFNSTKLLENDKDVPFFAMEFILSVFRELEIMVNGESGISILDELL